MVEMAGIYLCGSFRFVAAVAEVERLLAERGVPFQSSKAPDPRGIVSCLEKIDGADAVYVIDPDGYIGKSVAIDIGYAFARGKPIYSMEPIEDPPLDDLVRAVLSPAALARLLAER